VFRLSYFRDKPEAFYALARELYPDGARYRPTCTHWFIKLLQDRGCLLRNVTQNIDGLDLATGLSVGEHVVQAHGGFDRAACIECEAEGDAVQVRAEIMAGRIPRCTNCYDGLVKPAITFFGESLPEAFAKAAKEDLPVCDLLIVIGTSLQVQPFGGLINLVGDHVPRILINREPVGELMPRALQDAEYQAWRERLDYVSPDSCMREQIRQELARILQRVGGFQFRAHPERDIFLPGECDASVRHLAALIGDAWATQLEALVQAGAKTTPKQD
jgi:NAD-dependent SIR2 family protein deacetylase